MATITQPSTPAAAPADTAPDPPAFVFDGVSWDDYEAMLRIVGNRHVRVNYDRGRMEIMSPLRRHGNPAYLLARMVDTLVDELDVRYDPSDPVTYRRRDLEKGVEPDKSFYFGENAAKVSGDRELDLTVDPPPDLVIEVDVTSSSVERLPIFAALGIPEVWRFSDDGLEFLHLQPDGSYQPRDRSRAFPAFAVADAARLLEEGRSADKTAWVRSFRAFVREHVAPRPPGAP
jgi:Uma2 family endonuclease